MSAIKTITRTVVLYTAIILFVVPILIFLALGISSRNKNSQSVSEMETPAASSETEESTSVPLPSKEDVVRTFCNLIDEGRISEAVGMMETGSDSEAQAWGVNFNSLSSFKLQSIKKSSIDGSGNSFEVNINVSVKDGNESYGWVEGINKRWINLVEVGGGKYKIAEIATGP